MAELASMYAKQTPLHKRAEWTALNSIKMSSYASFKLYCAALEQIVSRLTAMGETVSDQRRYDCLVAGLPKRAGPLITILDTTAGMNYETARTKLAEFFDREEQ